MKKMIVATIAICLVAGAAFAAVPDGALSSANKLPIDKPGGGDPSKGLLDCSGAIEIMLDTEYSGDNTGLVSVVDAYGCSTWPETAGEVIFHLYLPEPAMFEGGITSVCDLDMAVLDMCDEDLGCLIVVDSGVVTNVPVSGDFYFVVDGYNGAECSFTLQINSVPLPEPVTFCDSIDDVTGTYFTGNTCAGANNISALGCEDYSEAGLEAYYEVFMPAGSSFTADVLNSADGALWVVDSCADPISCLAYADATFSGDVETVSYTNDTGSDMYVYLVIDSWGTASCGDYELTMTTAGGAIPAESVSFGHMKAMFR